LYLNKIKTYENREPRNGNDDRGEVIKGQDTFGVFRVFRGYRLSASSVVNQVKWSDMKKQAKIRVKVLAWIENGGCLFVVRMHDCVKGDDYYRPIGGSVEFGETTTAALHREVKEELDTTIYITGEPLVMENIFTCDGINGHEIDYLYPARFIDPMYSARKVFPLVEDNIETFDATWIDLETFLRGDLRLVPEGLLEWYRKRRQSS